MTCVPIIKQPVSISWDDAKKSCYAQAQTYGAAVVIAFAGKIGFRVIPAASPEECLDMAGDCPVLHSEVAV